MVENSVPRSKVFEIFTSEFEFRLFLTKEEKKTNLYGHPKMCSEKFPKTTMLHICRLELKKVAVKNIK